MVLLPRPDAPIIAVVSPAFISNVILLRVFLASFGVLAYLKLTLSNLIECYKLIIVCAL
jgi:hypothetical protein